MGRVLRCELEVCSMRHLVVLIHGLHGTAGDLAYLAKLLKARHAVDTHVLVPTCNEGKTGSGIDAQAQRVVDSIVNEASLLGLEKSETIAVSLIGHSLGGLIARMVAHKLIQPNFKLRHYVSIATPHIGSRFKSIIPPDAAAVVAGQTGKELFLMDDKDPLVAALAQAPFLDTLAAFESRTAYGCVQYDLSVGFETSLIRIDNPCLEPFSTRSITAPLKALMNSMPVAYSFNFTSLTSSQPQLRDVSTPAGEISSVVEPNTDASLVHIQQMLQSLNSLTWTKIAVFPTRPLFGHVDVIVQDERWNAQFGHSVIQDIVERVLEPQ
ncbi:putative serine esterase-domain-containing protein [Chytriomyces cf. hyalinus JEL632]|nr:putative serine esterase-domain-containing protein [Chytriomyces cf. hyalinus JEL632]